MALDGSSATFLPYTLNGLQDLTVNSSTVSTLQVNSLTPNRVVVSDGSDFLVSAAATSTEVDYLSGTTSNIQTQINSKASTSYVDTNFLNKVTATQQDVTAFCNFTSGVGSTTIGMSNGLQWYKNSAFQNSWSIVRQLGSGSILKDLVFRDNENSVDTLLLSEDGQKVYVGLTCDYTTASKIPIFDSSKKLVSSGVDSIKITYLDNVSSDIQTQLNSKLNLSGSNANQNIVLGTYKVQSTATPIVDDDLTRKGYVDSGLALKASLAANQTFTGTNTFSSSLPLVLSSLTPSRVLQLSASAVVQASAVTTTELGYVSGVTSAIQTQLNTLSGTFANYLPLTGGTLSGNLTVQGASGVSLTNVATTNGFLSTRFYIGARGDNQDDVGADDRWGPWYGLGESGIPNFTGVPCLAGYAGVALRTSSGVLVMKDDGGVGIGTADINGRFNIAHLGGVDFLTLQNINDSAGQYIDQRFMFGKSGVSRDAYLTSVINANDETDFVFYVHGSGLNERLRIKGNGNIYANALVGIGESSPSAPLHVKASGGSNPSTNGVYVHNTTNSAGQDAIVSVRVAGTAGGNPFVSFDVAGEIGWAWGMDNADNSMKLSNSWSSLTSATKMTINSLGRVGIGCGPTAPLTVGSVTIVDGATTPGVYQPGCIYTDVNWGMLFRGAVAANIAHMRWDNFGGATLMKIQNTGVLNFTGGGTGYAVENALTTRPGAVVIGNISNSYGGGWQAGLMMECQDTTEISCHDSGNRVTSFIYYDGANLLYMGRDIGWGVTPVQFPSRITVGNGAMSLGIINIWNPNGSITHFGWTDNHNYIRGLNTYIDTEAYFITWLRLTSNAGIYWQNLGRGLSSPELVGNSYGHVATYSSGRNGWSGYGLSDRYCFMKWDSGVQWGIHDNFYSWLIYGDGGVSRSVTIGGGVLRAAREYDRLLIYANGDNTAGGYFYYNQTNAYGVISDQRIKENIQESLVDKSIAFIKGLKAYQFRLKDKNVYKTKLADGTDAECEGTSVCNCLQDGWIAQNVLESAEKAGIPKNVCANWFDYQNELNLPEEERKTLIGVSDRPILCHTVTVVKELMEQLDVLTERNQVLESHARQLEKDFLDYKEQTDRRMTQLAELIRGVLEDNAPKLKRNKTIVRE